MRVWHSNRDATCGVSLGDNNNIWRSKATCSGGSGKAHHIWGHGASRATALLSVSYGLVI